MDNVDFFIPLHKFNFVIKIVVEGIIQNYNPRFIYIVTPRENVAELKQTCLNWKGYRKQIISLEDDTFFSENYYLDKATIEGWYCKKDNMSREFGWWYQQLLKLGALTQIPNISDPYVVWDSDLIPLEKWELYDNVSNVYKFAILQEKAKNDWNKQEYANSIFELIGVEPIEPLSGGTFVPHHFIMHHNVIQSLLFYIEKIPHKRKTKYGSWIEEIIYLSNDYYRFSEYKCIANYMLNFFNELLHYHPFEKYGTNGIRYRESEEIIDEIKMFFEKKNMKWDKIGYSDMLIFCKKNYPIIPSYIQIEHVC